MFRKLFAYEIFAKNSSTIILQNTLEETLLIFH